MDHVVHPARRPWITPGGGGLVVTRIVIGYGLTRNP